MSANRSIAHPMSFGILFAAGIVVVGYFLLFQFSTPDLHFKFHARTGVITQVDENLPITGVMLRVGDRILTMNGLPLAAITAPDAAPVASLVVSQHIPMRIQRGQREIDLNWPVTSPDINLYLLRTLQFLPATVFLAAAAFLFLFVRPPTQIILQLLVLFSLGAIWLSARVAADFNLRWSEGMFRAAIWLLIPSALHFVWLYPRTLHAIPGFILRTVYAVFILLALLDAFHLLHPDAYRMGLAMLGMTVPILILVHLMREPDELRDLRIVLVSLGLVVALATTFALFEQMFHSEFFYTLSFTALTGIPLAYIFPILRRQMTAFEMRANQALVMVSFTILTMILFIFITLLVTSLVTNVQVALPFHIILSVIYVVLAVSLYPGFNTWAQRRLLGIHIPSRDLMNRFTGRITTSLEVSRLVQVLCEDLAPSLLIRQLMFLRVDENGQPTPLAKCKSPFIDPVTADDIPVLLDMAGRYLPHRSANANPAAFSQVRLVLKLVIDGQLIGLTLFGRRDPDDFYSTAEIEVLQTLMDQAALALVNIAQAERLHDLYQENIQRTDSERHSLARELHDDVLGPMAVMMMSTSGRPDPERFHTAYQAAAGRIRSIIEGLRPSTLDQGLMLAIEELIGQITGYAQDKTIILNKVNAKEVRYPPEVEMQVFRILQETCQNAILHGKASQIIISGKLHPNLIELLIVDNGVGFDSEGLIDLTTLLRRRHYGLAGIYERAALIEAVVKIESAPQQGTRISLVWSGN